MATVGPKTGPNPDGSGCSGVAREDCGVSIAAAIRRVICFGHSPSKVRRPNFRHPQGMPWCKSKSRRCTAS